jgi:hypothetical protein
MNSPFRNVKSYSVVCGFRGAGQFLPHLKVFWEKVNGQTAEIATAFLQGQLEAESRGSLSFFGIPIERNLAISAGPIVCLSILLFFWLHIRQFRVVAAEVNSVPQYPFVALFKSPFAALAVIFVTVLVLPVAANVELLARFGQLHERSTQISCVAFVGIVALSILSIVELQREKALVRLVTSRISIPKSHGLLRE